MQCEAFMLSHFGLPDSISAYSTKDDAALRKGPGLRETERCHNSHEQTMLPPNIHELPTATQIKQLQAWSQGLGNWFAKPWNILNILQALQISFVSQFFAGFMFLAMMHILRCQGWCRALGTYRTSGLCLCGRRCAAGQAPGNIGHPPTI